MHRLMAFGWGLLLIWGSVHARPAVDSLPPFPRILTHSLEAPEALDSAGWSVGAGVEPLYALGSLQSSVYSGSGGWGGTGLLELRGRDEASRWEIHVKGQYRRVPGVSGAWHDLAYNWGVLDGWGRASTPTLTSIGATRLEGLVTHRFSPSMRVQLGQVARHWGHGWRSAWMDQAAAPLPQLALQVDGGRVRYEHVMASKRVWSEGAPPDLPGTDPNAWAPWQYAERNRSFLAAHSVSADLGRGFQGSLFGAVTWMAVDSGIPFRLEPAYFVPFVAFRPTEYRLGSADNALIGLEGAWRSPDGRWLLSSQWLFDEWVTREVFGDRGWWANKWSTVHTIQRKGDVLHALLERCAARPYTYSHAVEETAWTHDRSPIAHPLGANFIEWRVRGIAAWERVRVSVGATYVRQGVDDVEAALKGGRSIIGAADADAPSSVGTSPLLSYTLRPVEDGVGDLFGEVVTTWRGFADVEWAHERLGFGRLFLRAAGRWAEAGEGVWWGRLEFGLRVQPALEERDW